MALQSLDIKQRSATTTPAPSVRKTAEVAKLIDVSACIGCKACQAACMEWNDIRDEVGINYGVYDNPVDLTAQLVDRDALRRSGGERPAGMADPQGRLHALRRPGLPQGLSVPRRDRQVRQRHRRLPPGELHRLRLLHHRLPLQHPAHLQEDSKAYKCTLCSDRVAVGQAPACAKACPTGAIQFGSKEDMKDYAAKRIGDLKERGFDKAGLYDPAGVGGTHVLYVLHHADRPQLYNGLPADPGISPLVSLWKGMAKPLASLALGAVALGSLFHYVMKGPNEVSKETEKEVEKEGSQ
jgi:formate dehydrogenase beta subunit (EC 1.2.1.2)